MADNPMKEMTLGKWIAVCVVLAVVAFALLIQFTSFQIPKTLTEGKQEPAVHEGIQPGDTTVPNNLDAVNEIIRGGNDNMQNEETGNEN